MRVGFPRIRHVAFDVGGVLRDSRSAMLSVLRRVCDDHLPAVSAFDGDAICALRGLAKFNKLEPCLECLAALGPETGARLAALTEGADAEAKLAAVVDAARPALDAAAIDAAAELYRTLFAADDLVCPLFPTAAATVAALRDVHGVGVSVLSNSTLPAVERDLGPELIAKMDFVVCRAEKPDPAVFLRARFE
jgi:phosphoglycolate phosphatase-like HAD superfamily hydrolase